MQHILQPQTIGLGNTPDGGKTIQVVDKNGDEILLQLTAEQARSIGAALSSSVAVAGASLLGQLPPYGGGLPRGNGH